MPETSIGFFTDVGSSYFFNIKVKPAVAKYLALTGQRLNASELLEHGFATHYVLSENIPRLKKAIVDFTIKKNVSIKKIE